MTILHFMDVRLVFLIEGNSKVLQRHIKIVELGLHVSLWEYKFRDFLDFNGPFPPSVVLTTLVKRHTKLETHSLSHVSRTAIAA